MNREIKFRFWIEHSKFMTESITLDKIFDYQDQVLNNITMQFTGLFDQNDKEIYEGDFIKNIDNIYYKVIFKDGSFTTTYNDIHCIELNCFYKKNIKIIGNIYENPELLTI